MTKPCIKCGAEERNKCGGCKACAKEAVRKWQKNNREKVAAYQRKYRKANLEKVAEINRKWSDANREHIAERMRKYNKSNWEKQFEHKRKWRKLNPERRKELNHNRRARIKGNGGTLSINIIKTLLIQQKGKCACCGLSLHNGYHLDHIMPIALGGMNNDSNVQLLTPICNMRKGSKHPNDYMREKGKLI